MVKNLSCDCRDLIFFFFLGFVYGWVFFYLRVYYDEIILKAGQELYAQEQINMLKKYAKYAPKLYRKIYSCLMNV